MADISWGEAVGGTVAGIVAGIAGTVRALKSKSNGNGNGWHGIDKRVSFLERDYATIKAELDKHDSKLDDIRDDLSKIMAAVDRRAIER